MAISEYPEPSRLENYARVVAVDLGLQRASFHGITDFHPYSTTAKLLPLYTYKRVLSEPQNLTTMMGSHCRPYIAVARKFMQGRHANRYFQPKRSLISANARRPYTSLIFVTCNLRKSVKRAKPVAVTYVAVLLALAIMR